MKALQYTIITAVCFSLVACGNPTSKIGTYESDMMQSARSPMMKQTISASPLRDSAPEQNASTHSEMLLAYRYNYQFAIPLKNLEAVAQKAVLTCQNAGASKCRIVTSSLNKHSEDFMSANIELRVEPNWFKSYQEGLKADSIAASGKLTNSSVSAEDLTIAISDSGAKLKALKTLRTRLFTLLETKGSVLKDIIEVERELARVQEQIESSTARLRVLRTRVNMSQVHLSYEPKSAAASRSSFTPITQALTEFVSTVAFGLANVIRFIAFALPWLILILPAFWVVRKWLRRRRARKQA